MRKKLFCAKKVTTLPALTVPDSRLEIWEGTHPSDVLFSSITVKNTVCHFKAGGCLYSYQGKKNRKADEKLSLKLSGAGGDELNCVHYCSPPSFHLYEITANN
jgi:hypothetical protein